jgi:hypothetical protein
MGSSDSPHIVSPRHPGREAKAAPNQNIENNPMQRYEGAPASMFYPQKHFDTSGKSPALI